MDTNLHQPDVAPGHAGLPQHCRHALDLMLTHRGNAAAEIGRVLAEHPNSVVAHCLRAARIVLADDRAARPALAASLSVIEAGTGPGDPARRHADAAQAWLDGNSSLAAERYGGIARDWPRDIIALVVAHAFDFRLGQRHMLRDRIAQALPAWDAATPGYASVLAMYAFGLEENGQYDAAEQFARRALGLDPRLASAIHVVSHVMEMQGRTREGLAFLTSTEAAWREGTGFSVHLAWHKALFHLEAADPQSALAIYDQQIARANTADMPVLADASALLWRLQLRSTEVGGRWQVLADHWEKQSLAGQRPFYVVHAMMAFAAAQRSATAARVLDMLHHGDEDGASPAPPEEALAAPFCEALLAFTRGDYAASVEWLQRVRHIADRCGGSLAQCDLIHLTFTEAALRARKARLAGALVAERAARKPASRFNQLLQQRLREMPAAA